MATRAKIQAARGVVLSLLIFPLTLNAFSLLGMSDDARYQKRAAKPPVDWSMPVAEGEIKIMTYNVENLFDATHDEGKEDFEFLPVSHPLKSECAKQGSYRKQCEETDWTVEKMMMKLTQIQRVIESQGVIPDLLALEEVENPKVVGLLAKQLGYSSFVMTNSPDKRGVDVALLFNETKLKLISFKEKPLEIPNLFSRNLMVANFSINGRTDVGSLGIFVNHWPSQGKSSQTRVSTAQALKKFVDEEMAKNPGYHAILVGDFNTIDSDKPHPFREVILNSSWSARFEDAQELFESLKLKQVLKMPPASYFFANEGTWNKLDHLFLGRALYDGKGLEVMPESFRIVAPEFASRAYEFYSSDHHFYSSVIFGIPKKYNHDTKNAEVAGYSDHFPVSVKLKY